MRASFEGLNRYLTAFCASPRQSPSRVLWWAALTAAVLTGSVSIKPAAAASLTLSAPYMTGTDTCLGTFTYDGPNSPGGLTLGLSSSNPNAATVPASVTMLHGYTSVDFLVETSDVAQTTTLTITGVCGDQSASADLTITPYSGPTDCWRIIATYSGSNAFSANTAAGTQWQELFEQLQNQWLWPNPPQDNVDISLGAFVNQPVTTTSGGLTAHISSALGFAVGLGSSSGQLTLTNGQINVKLIWLPQNHDPIADPPPQTVRLYARRKVTVAAGSVADCDNSSASNEANASCDSVSIDTGPIAVTGPNQSASSNPTTASDPGFVSRDVNVSAAGIATTSFGINWTFTASAANASGAYCADVGGMSSADIVVDICLPGFDTGRFHGPLVPFGGGSASKSTDPSFTRWLPLSFSPVVTAQTFNMWNANTIPGLPTPWGNLNCNYSIRLEQEPDTPNPDYEGKAIEYLPGPGSDGTYNNPQAPNQVVNPSLYFNAITDANGDRLQFDKNFNPAPDVKSILTQYLATAISPAHFVLSHAGPPGHLRERGNYTYTFETVGPTWGTPDPALVARLTSIADDLGNQQTLTYTTNNSNPYLVVTDSSSGRKLIFNGSGLLGYISSVDAPSSIPGVINTHTTLNFTPNGQLLEADVYDGATQALLASDTFGTTETHGMSTVSHTYQNDPLVTDPFGWPILRLSSDTYGTNDSASSDDGYPIAGTYSYGYGPISMGYNTWSQAAHTNTVTDPRGNLFSTQYLLSGDIHGMTGSITGTISTAPDYTGAPPNSNVSRVTYTPDIHQPSAISVQDPLGNTWQSVLDGFGNLQSVQDPSQHQWSWGYNEDGTLLTSSTDPTNLTWLFHYGETDNGYTNPASRLTSVLDPVGNTRVKIDYNTFGQPITLTTPAAVAASGADEQTQFAYDATTGDLSQVTTPLGDQLNIPSYDALGDPLSVFLSPGNSPPLTTLIHYNAAQMPVMITGPNGVQLQTGFSNGVPTQFQVLDPAANVLAQMNLAIDSRGRVYSASDLLGTAEQMRYDRSSNLTQIWDGNANKTLFSYGPNDEPTGVTWPDNNQTSVLYDAAGRVSSQTDERGIVSTDAYNAANQLTDIVFPATPYENVHFSYDPAGRPLSVSDNSGTRTYTYDAALGRLQSVVTTLSGIVGDHNTFTTSYSYFGDGKLQSVTSPAGTTSYQYDASGRLIVLDSPNGDTTSWSYDHAGRVTGQNTLTSTGTQINTAYTWGTSEITGDPSNAPAYLSHITQTVNGITLYDYALQHSFLGQLAQQQGTSAGTQTSNAAYLYDARGRLMAENSSFQPTGQAQVSATALYSYDLANNLNAGANGWTYNADNQVTSAISLPGVFGGTGLQYDASGNLTGIDGASLTYDAFGNLASGLNGVFAYDSSGRRISKNIGGQTTFYLYEGDTLIAELDVHGNLTRTYTWGPLGLISDQAAGQSRYYLFDALGNTRALLDTNGNVVGQGAYTAWGSVMGGYSPGTPFAWKGQFGAYFDAETHLYLMGARYYSADLGRFLSRDPSGFSAGPNLYAYCADDPVNFFDVTGMGPEEDEGMFWDGVRSLSTMEGWVHDHYMTVRRFMPVMPSIPKGGVATAVIGAHDAFYDGGTTQAAYDKGKASAWDVFKAYWGMGYHFADAALSIYGAGKMASATLKEMQAAREACAGLSDCFIAGTKVQVCAHAGKQVCQGAGNKAEAVTVKAIEQVKAGDEVVSRDQQTGKTEFKRVEKITVRSAGQVLTIKLADAKVGKVVETITTTKEHPFYVEGKGFVLARGLGIGTAIVTRAGPALIVKSVEWHHRPQGYKVYNFEIADDHSYFVGIGNGGAWVHNGVRCPGSPFSEPTRYRMGVRDKVWNAAMNDGKVLDPATQQEIDANSAWHMGHRPGYEFRKLVSTATEENWSRKRFLNAYNNPDHYRPESPETSRSHVGEAGNDVNYYSSQDE